MTENWKPPKPDKPQYVQCMKCDNYDDVDQYCLVFQKIMTPYPERFKCRRYIPID